MARIRHETQIHILNLLITSLELNGPNLGLYLLGYEVKKPVSSTNLQDPGQFIQRTSSLYISDMMKFMKMRSFSFPDLLQGFLVVCVVACMQY